MKILNHSDRIYDLGKFQVPPGRRATVVPEGCEELAAQIAAKFAPELEIADSAPPQPDARDLEIAELKAKLEAAKAVPVKAEAPAKVEVKNVRK